MQTSTKICKYQVTTTLKMSIGYLQILPLFFVLSTVECDDFCCTFAMTLMILLVLICSTKVSEISDMAKS